ncbi:hypothetical protein DFH07DRAFT_759640 [Mycena maculata]|uniref:Uncharacterized protein n=1 Tax=Mycena maculata TaxID=230809 RepID=A0AAD7MMP1_9AGAR|nr:hypothetical protein DFH07DRAFT_759640 [Mycena maculata]
MLDVSLVVTLYIWHLFTPLLVKKEGQFFTGPLHPYLPFALPESMFRSSRMLKASEMCLVPGFPGPGCTTFLKIIANDREIFGEVLCEVLYKQYRNIIRISLLPLLCFKEIEREISNISSVALADFFFFSKTPGPNICLPGIPRKKFDVQIQDTLLHMLNIVHTLVGDEFIRRVSGGERKRISIVGVAHVQSWDNSTRGHDSCIYYLTGCTDHNECQFADGRSANNTTSTPQALESTLLSPQITQHQDNSREKYKLLMETEKKAFRAAIAADKKTGVSKKSPYIGFTGQVRTFARQQFQMKIQDKFHLITSFTLSTMLVLLIGAAFINLLTTLAGVFTRGG